MTARCDVRRSALNYGVAGVAMGLGSVLLAFPASAQSQTAGTAQAGDAVTSRSDTPSPGTDASDAQQGLQDIIVTAERRTSDVQRTAAAVTVQSGDALRERGKFTLRNILETVPSVSGGESEGVSNEPTGNDSPAAGISIRGVSSNGGLSGQTVSGVTAVAAYTDDVYGGIGGNYDIDRVEVLRGPQGTLYGRSATAGLVATHTRNPDLHDVGFEGAVEAGSYDLFHITGAVNVPIVDDTLALRVAGNHYERDGVDVERGFGASNTSEAKAKLLFKPSDSVFSLLVGGAFQDRQLYNGGIVGNLVKPDKVQYVPSVGGKATTKIRQVWAEANVDLGGVHATYLPAYRTFTQDATVFVVGPAGAIIKQAVNTPYDKFVTQELRLSSGDTSGIRWQTGIFYYYNNIRSTNTSGWNSSNGLLFSAQVQRKTRDIGVFAEATVPLTDALRITAGARYDKNTVATNETYTSNLNGFCNTPLPFIGCSTPAFGPPNAPNAGLPLNNVTLTVGGSAGRREFKNTTYKLRAEYDLTPVNLLYASVSNAYLPGDVQIGTGAGNLPTVFLYDSKELVAYEIGSKNRFFDRRVQLNLGVFHYDYAGYQANLLLDTSNPASAFQFSVPLRMTGVEVETLFQLTPRDRVGVNFSRIGTKFHDLPPGFAAVVAQRELWGFPLTTGTLFYDHDFGFSGGSNVNLHLEAIYRGEYDVLFTSPTLAAQGGLDYERQKPVVLGNVSLTWTSADSRFSLTGYVRNLFDERFKTYTNVQSITPLQATATQSDPRTFGGVLTVRF